MSTPQFQFKPPQITLSQYEYRIARLPKRKYPRRRRRLHFDESAAIEENQSEQQDSPVVTDEDVASEEPLLDHSKPQLDQGKKPVLTNSQIHSSSSVHSQQLQYDAGFTAPIAPMILNDDDLELLQLGETSDNDVPRFDDIDDMLVLQELENDTHSKRKRKRRSTKIAPDDRDFVDTTTQRSKKKRKRASEAVLPWTDQLIMMRDDMTPSGSPSLEVLMC